MPGRGSIPPPHVGLRSLRALGVWADKIRTQTADATEAQLVGRVHSANACWALTRRGACLLPASLARPRGQAMGMVTGRAGLAHPRLFLSRRQLARLLLTDHGRGLTRPGGRCKLSTPGLLSLRGKAVLLGEKDVGTYREREGRVRPLDRLAREAVLTRCCRR